MMRPKSWMLLNTDVLVGYLNMNFEKGMAVIDLVTMHEAHRRDKPRSYIKYGRALLCYTQIVVNQ
jgi:hypothetical protein